MSMIQKKSKEFLGIVLILTGLLFLLANYHILWIKWKAIWPVFLLLLGGFLLRVFIAQKKPAMLFAGLVSLFLGFFFLLFTMHIVPWGDLDALWPTFPLIGGVSLLAISGLKQEAPGALVIGAVVVVFSVACYIYAGGMIGSRVAGHFVKLWPLFLVGSGALVVLRARNMNDHPRNKGQFQSVDNAGAAKRE